jgi:hypothetical protein
MSTPTPTAPLAIDAEMGNWDAWEGLWAVQEFNRLHDLNNSQPLFQDTSTSSNLMESQDPIAPQEQDPDSPVESSEDDTLWGSPPSPNVSSSMSLALPVPSESFSPFKPPEMSHNPFSTPPVPEGSIIFPHDQPTVGSFADMLSDSGDWNLFGDTSNNDFQLEGIPEEKVTGPTPTIESSPVVTESNTEPQSQVSQFDSNLVANDALESVLPELKEASKTKKSRSSSTAAKGKPKRSPTKGVGKRSKRLSGHKLAQEQDKEGYRRLAQMRAEQYLANHIAQTPPFGGAPVQSGGRNPVQNPVQNPAQNPAQSLYTQDVFLDQTAVQLPNQSLDLELFGQSLPEAQYPLAVPSRNIPMPQHPYQYYQNWYRRF